MSYLFISIHIYLYIHLYSLYYYEYTLYIQVPYFIIFCTTYQPIISDQWECGSYSTIYILWNEYAYFASFLLHMLYMTRILVYVYFSMYTWLIDFSAGMSFHADCWCIAIFVAKQADITNFDLDDVMYWLNCILIFWIIFF